MTYYQNKINVEIFHALTDGSTAIEFVKTIVYYYLNLYYPSQFKEPFTIKKVQADTKNIEDSYLKIMKSICMVKKIRKKLIF